MHPICFACWSSTEELEDALDYYSLTIHNASLLLYNLVHHAGKIYDSIFYLVAHHKAFDQVADAGTEGDVENWWYKTGIYYGTLTFLIFYTPPKVDPFDPLEAYPGLDNGAHIDYYDDLEDLVDSLPDHEKDSADIMDVLDHDIVSPDPENVPDYDTLPDSDSSPE